MLQHLKARASPVDRRFEVKNGFADLLQRLLVAKDDGQLPCQILDRRGWTRCKSLITLGHFSGIGTRRRSANAASNSTENVSLSVSIVGCRQPVDE